jgi:hypothetical protein
MVMKEITLVIRPTQDGDVYEIHSPSHPHLKIIQRPHPDHYAALTASHLNAQQAARPVQ